MLQKVVAAALVATALLAHGGRFRYIRSHYNFIAVDFFGHYCLTVYSVWAGFMFH